MIYMHYCKKCDYLHMLSGHRTNCPGCNDTLTELKISYMDYYKMDLKEREALAANCRNEDFLKKSAYVYKKHKFSKWYKEGRERG
ncbi:MAG: hypothetical protein E7285_01625 [Lachnospiraceae bacterium]|nr:hypothetical protein [Lachnospiraceae bacterium]